MSQVQKHTRRQLLSTLAQGQRLPSFWLRLVWPVSVAAPNFGLVSVTSKTGSLRHGASEFYHHGVRKRGQASAMLDDYFLLHLRQQGQRRLVCTLDFSRPQEAFHSCSRPHPFYPGCYWLRH